MVFEPLNVRLNCRRNVTVHVCDNGNRDTYGVTTTIGLTTEILGCCARHSCEERARE